MYYICATIKTTLWTTRYAISRGIINIQLYESSHHLGKKKAVPHNNIISRCMFVALIFPPISKLCRGISKSSLLKQKSEQSPQHTGSNPASWQHGGQPKGQHEMRHLARGEGKFEWKHKGKRKRKHEEHHGEKCKPRRERKQADIREVLLKFEWLNVASAPDFDSLPEVDLDEVGSILLGAQGSFQDINTTPSVN
ncbi:hypothetical protein BGW80DRAFT_1328799 [Lactifluus volemus]|nr:hypothetical protein BGW80DRAFT_1328799 [Lactifluus volemus]